MATQNPHSCIIFSLLSHSCACNGLRLHLTKWSFYILTEYRIAQQTYSVLLLDYKFNYLCKFLLQFVVPTFQVRHCGLDLITSSDCVIGLLSFIQLLSKQKHNSQRGKWTARLTMNTKRIRKRTRIRKRIRKADTRKRKHHSVWVKVGKKQCMRPTICSANTIIICFWT